MLRYFSWNLQMSILKAISIGLLGLVASTQVVAQPCEWEGQSLQLKQLIASAVQGRLDRELATDLSTSEIAAVRKASSALLEECDTSKGKDQLEPRLLWINDPSPESLEKYWSRIPSIIVSGEVTEEGVFRRPYLNKGTGNPKLDRLILHSASCAIFLPKTRGGEAMVAPASIVVRWPRVGSP